ncbi:glycerophosphodiester phosphodiesterase [Microbulbifer celer]|uniref:Glycerophosphodiester phosphodiesterase n=1 Tax=Microbulbifer celer TaxID=435905 RepID=A0ABW3U474_9GAMM|nr:glycerophosphodiester phosphodiesterase [Microbulbifer celer]UFN57687.1 glycerophosphodiester phosphodiesterase [Microbulbifer celer]
MAPSLDMGGGRPFAPEADHRPLVIAHGDESGQGLFPGNTLLYLQQMVALGVGALEMDLNLTADNQLVLMHDPTLERTTDGQGQVREHSLAELRQLNAAYHWRAVDISGEPGPYPYRDNSLPIVTIDEVFEAVPDTPKIIELKNDDPAAAEVLSRAIDNARCQDRVIVSSFHQAVISRFRALSPTVATGATMREALKFFVAQLVGVERLLNPAYQTMQLPMRFHGIPVFTRRFIRAARRHRLHLSVWTVDEELDMQRYIELGLDGIVTNRPDRLLALR